MPEVVTFERRARALEQLFTERSRASETRRGGRVREELFAILDELASLKASRAVHYRGGVRIEPKDIPARILGPDYTRAELLELAISRALERRGYSTGEIAELIPVWVERFEHFDRLRAEIRGDPHSRNE